MGKAEREKGARGERWLRDELRGRGWYAERGKQRHGGPDSPDVRCKETPVPFHWEMKFGYQRLSIPTVLRKCSEEAPEGSIPCGVWKQMRKPAIAFLPLDNLLDLLERIDNLERERIQPSDPQAA